MPSLTRHALSLCCYVCRNRLELKENADTGVYVKDLTSFVVKSAQEIDNVMQVRRLPQPSSIMRHA